MFFAIEPSSGVEVSADTARPGWTYRCPTCGARVVLRRGPERADHFAHLQWAANPDCENYTPSRFEYRRRPPGEGRPAGPGVATSYMSFTLSNYGPRLAYWLPPAADAHWTGAIELEAHDTSRVYQARNLRNGQRVDFPLVDGQWEVRDTGEVADEYLELLSRGRQSLDTSGSIFDATSAAGRQIVPGQSVTYGQTLHWVSRVALDQQARGVRLCAVERLCLASGWHVYRIELPEMAYTGDEFMELIQWLERRIRPARPKVWIESPWPIFTMESGFSVYDPVDGELVLQAERPVDIRVSDARTGADVLLKFSRQRLTLPSLPVGVYDIYINDLPHETFVVGAGSEEHAAGVLVKVADLSPVSLAYAQPVLSAMIASGRRSVPLLLTWCHPAVGTVVSLNGRALSHGESTEAAVVISPGMRLDAAGLGSLEWPSESGVAFEPGRPFPTHLRERAAWLLSMASTSILGVRERIAVPESLQKEAMFRRLATASWRPELAPQVRALSTSLSEWR